MSATADVDFDLHGFVGVRLLDPTPADVARVMRQLGPLESPLGGRTPDITVRFVDAIRDDRALTYAGWLDSGWTDDTYYLLRGRDGVPARALLPMSEVGGRCDIVCERGVGPVPHLLAVLNFTALAKGVLPLHASAFTYRGLGVVATGWAKGGKTETLLAFAQEGAHYVGDEWVYLTPDGAMFGVPEPIRLWYWQLRQLPHLRARLSRATRARLTGLPAVATVAERMAARLPGSSLPSSVLRRAAPLVRRQAHVQIPPAELFGPDAIDLRGQVDTFLLLTSHDRDTVTVDPIDAGEVGRRMLASLDDERAPFMAHYRQFRFAFPDRRSEVVERATELERDLLDKLLIGLTAHVVRHPYPMRIDELVDPIRSVLGTPSSS